MNMINNIDRFNDLLNDPFFVDIKSRKDKCIKNDEVILINKNDDENSINLLVPEKAFNIIEKSTYKKKHQLYLILDLIYKQFNKFKDNRSAFAEISTKKFNKVINSNRDRYMAKKWLIDNDIIIVDNSYCIGGFSKGYFFSNSVLSKPILYKYKTKPKQNKPTTINHFSIMKDYFINNFFLDTDKVLQEINKDFPVINGKMTNHKLYNKYFGWLNGIQFNYYNNNLLSILLPQKFSKSYILVASKNLFSIVKKTSLLPQNSLAPKTKTKTKSYLNQTKDNSQLYQNYIKQLNNLYIKKTINIDLIKAHNLTFDRNETNNRIDTNLTVLNSKYKKYILSQNKLGQIDISNSQPYLFSLLLKQNNNLVSKPDVSLFIQLCETGQLYDHYSSLINKNRKYVKKLFFKILYSKPTSYQKQKDIFRITFPNIMNYIDKVNKTNHNQLSIKLQKLESEIIIDIICPRLIENKIIPFTIHDCFIVDYNQINTAKQIVEDCFYNKYNSIPDVKIEPIN